MRGCTVYAGRPLACRVFGPMSQERIEWEFCSYQDTSRVYSSPGEIPLWDRYLELVRDSERGYVFPDQVQFERPALEMLLGFDNPAPRQPRISLD